MKLNKFKAAAVLACAVLAGPAIAQTRTFTGWGVGLQAHAGQNKFQLNADNQPESGKYETSTSPVALIGSFGFAMGANWVGTVGLSYDLGNTDFGTVVMTGGAGDSTIIGKNHLALSFAPGYRIGERGQVYAKLAHHQMTFAQLRPGFSDASVTIGGIGLGLGYAMALTQQIELRAEYETVDYEKQRGGTPKQDRFGLSLLYKF